MRADFDIPKRILGTLLNSLGSGVVPRTGLEYIAIGRQGEIGAVADDLEFIADGGAVCRFIIGRYGSGKSFLLQLIRTHALESGFVAADADLSPERRLSGTKGQGVATYRELVASLSTKSAPDGNALGAIISRYLAQTCAKIMEEKNLTNDSPKLDSLVSAEIIKISSSLEGMVCGFDFGLVLSKLFTASRSGDEELKSHAMRWLRGEFQTRTEARAVLGTGNIISDENWYEVLKLIALFVRKIGYKGFVIFVDECVNLYKIANRISRENNFEKLLTIFNDTTQGKAHGIGVYLGGTPQFLEDSRRGLYSYEALRSRLAENRFAGAEYKNFSGPVLRLERLSDDEILALALRVASLHKLYRGGEKNISDDDIIEFLKVYMSKSVASSLITPRDIIRDLLGILDIIAQNPGAKFSELIKNSAPVNDEAEKPESIRAFDITLEDIEV